MNYSTIHPSSRYWPVVFCLFFFLFGAISLQAQFIYFSDEAGLLYRSDPNDPDCNVEFLGNMWTGSNSAPLIASDLAFHPNGNLYAIDGTAFYVVDLNTLEGTLIAPLVGQAIGVNALVSAADGTMYMAGSFLFEIDVNTGVTIQIGDFLPCLSGGDLAFNGGELYLACSNNDLLLVNIDNPSASTVVGTMQSIDFGFFFGVVTYSTNCGDTETYGFANGSIYQVDVSNANATFECELINGFIFGATMDTDFLAADCDYIIDLDGDNSTGALGLDYQVVHPCGENMSFIADEDVEVYIEGPFDSVVITLTGGIQDGTAEQLDYLGDIGPFIVEGQGTTQITIINNGSTTAADLETALMNIIYDNTANPFTPGERQIEVQLFASDGDVSDIAVAYVTIVGPIDYNFDLGPDVTLCEGETLVLDATQDWATAYLWQDNSTESTLEVTETGLYSVTITDDCDNESIDDIFVTFEAPPAPLDLGPDTTLCPGQSLLLDATIPGATAYSWQDDSDEPIYTVTNPGGLFAVSVTVDCGLLTDEIQVNYFDTTTINLLPADTLLCAGDSLSLDATLPDALGYLWNDGLEEPIRTIDAIGDYAVTVTLPCGDYSESISVDILDQVLTLDLGPDTTFCFGDSVVLDGEQFFPVAYLWENGSTQPERTIYTTGQYALTVTDGCTEVTDEVRLELISCCEVYVPNAFTPNFDGNNDYFLTYFNCPILDFRLQIFDRWGAEVFSTNDPELGWDGIFKGQVANDGVYVWLLTYNDGLSDQQLSGDVTLVR